MSEIYIPFTHGQSEAIDAKLLPQGTFVSATDVRYTKDARLVTRYAYRYDPTTPAFTFASPMATAQHDDKVVVVISTSATASQFAAQFTVRSNGSFSSSGALVTGGSWLGPFQMQASDSSLSSTFGYGAVDTVSSGGVLYVIASTPYNLTTKAASGSPSPLRLFRLLADGRVTHTKILLVVAAGAKLVVVNGVLCVFYADTTANTVVMMSFSLTNLTAISGAVTVVTSLAGKAPYFDVSPGASTTEAYLVYMSAASTLRFGTVTSAGVFSQLSTIAGTGTELRPSISPTGLAPTDQVVIVWNDGNTFSTGNARYTVYRRSTSSFLIGTTSVDTSGNVQGYPVVSASGSTDTSDWFACFNKNGASFAKPYYVGLFVSGGSASYLDGGRLASKPVVSGIHAHVIVTNVDDPTAAPGSYYAMDVGVSFSVGLAYPEAIFSQFVARPADATAILSDPRRRVAAGTVQSRTPGAGAFAVALPTQGGTVNGWRLLQSEYGDRGDNWSSAKLNGQTVFSGPVLRTFDGQIVNEDNFHVPPKPTLFENVGAGTSIAAGTYQFVAVYESFDAQGRRIRSAPSLPVSITLSAGSSVSIYTSGPFMTGLFYAFGPNQETVAIRFYRTKVSGTVFFDAFGASQTFGFTPTVTLADAAIASFEVLYTQGAQGGLSGVLQNDQPPGCKYIWAGADRLIIGGLENSSEVWWSKARTQGEPIEWANFDSFKAQIDGRVSAVSEMDGTWFAFTYNSIWTITGPGPDDNGAGGFFDAPRKLPSDVGCISHKSLVMTGKGLIFQAAADRLYMLPRGSSEPQPVGWQVRDTLAAYPYIAAAAFNQTSNVAYWAVTNTAGTVGRLLVFDTRVGEWYVDNPCNGRAIRALAIYDGKLLIDGSILETAGNYADYDGTTTTNVIPALTTGDIRPFGMEGRGRLRKVSLLGEARDVATAFTPSLSISYDSGKTFSTPVTWPIASLAGAIGDAFEAQYLVQYPKGEAYRFALTITTPSATEGIVWHGLSLEAYAENGLNRLPASRRT